MRSSRAAATEPRLPMRMVLPESIVGVAQRRELLDGCALRRHEFDIDLPGFEQPGPVESHQGIVVGAGDVEAFVGLVADGAASEAQSVTIR
ncbi:MAG: hypothetical protein O7H40_10145 [Gammaproteobacteria bacterium]|nr:hypothetical protein [Gammaproteobacteria bacterium]